MTPVPDIFQNIGWKIFVLISHNEKNSNLKFPPKLVFPIVSLNARRGVCCRAVLCMNDCGLRVCDALSGHSVDQLLTFSLAGGF